MYKTYEEPEFDKEGKYISKKIKRAPILNPDQTEGNGDLIDNDMLEDQEMLDDLKREMALPEGTLVTNLFVPSMVLCSKIDLIEHGERDIKETLERNLDFIQQDLRKFCLQFGSSLVFASSNQNSNIELIYHYILSRLYNQEFPHPSNTSDKEALFIPTGLDSEDMISQTADLTTFLNKVK